SEPPAGARAAATTAAVERGQIGLAPPSAPPPGWPRAASGGIAAAVVAMEALALSAALLLAATSVSLAAAEPARGLAGLTTIGVDVDEALSDFLDAYHRR